MREKVKHVKR